MSRDSGMAEEIIDGFVALELDVDPDCPDVEAARTNRDVWRSALDLTEFSRLRRRQPCDGRPEGIVRDEFYACEWPERQLLPVTEDWVLVSTCERCCLVVLALMEGAHVGIYDFDPELSKVKYQLLSEQGFVNLGRDINRLAPTPLARILRVRLDRLLRAIQQREEVPHG